MKKLKLAWKKYQNKMASNNLKKENGELKNSDIAWEGRHHKAVTKIMREMGMSFEYQISWMQENS